MPCCNVLLLTSDWAAAGLQGLILDASLLKELKKLNEEQEQQKSLEKPDLWEKTDETGFV